MAEGDRQLVDSCMQVFHHEKQDTSKINAIEFIVEESWDNNVWPRYSKWIYDYSKHKIKESKTKNKQQVYKKILVESVVSLGYFNGLEKNYTNQLKYYIEALELYKELDNKKQTAKYYITVGYSYANQGDIPLAVDNYFKSLKISKEIKDDKNIAACYLNLGTVYHSQKDYVSAAKYFNKAAKIYKRLNDIRGISTAYNNIGFMKKQNKKYKIALDYFNKSLSLCKDSIYDKEKANALHNIAGTYSTMNELDKALKYYSESIKYRKKAKDYRGLVLAYGTYSGIHFKLGNFKEAKLISEKGFKLSEQIKDIKGKKANAIIISEIAEKEGNGKLALDMYKLFIQLRDSLNNENTQKATAKQQAKYEYEKQKAIDDTEYEKQIAIEQEAKAKQTIITYSSSAGLAVVIIFLIFVFNRLQVTKKQKLVIESQKIEVEQQKTEVEKAHTELEEKNKEITDSIQYAKRIQSAILPSIKVVKEYLNESFILYKPKDIVAGDFYWLEHNDNEVLFAAADCTGHGVPGAMVSVVCNNGLNRSVREYGLTNPGEILDKTREIVIAEFEKSEDEVKDGMDIALCSLKEQAGSWKLKYAGANNPLWIIRKGEKSIEEIKANKQPIGQFINPVPYTTHTLNLQKGDSIYIFSDGYVDQFGGGKGKKLKASTFRELLLSIQSKPMEEQRIIIDTTFENWRGDLEQIDDVCVIGVRV